MKTFHDVSPYNASSGNQTVQGPIDSFSANCLKGFERFQAMYESLIKQNDNKNNNNKV